jgi:hypothetical protein
VLGPNTTPWRRELRLPPPPKIPQPATPPPTTPPPATPTTLPTDAYGALKSCCAAVDDDDEQGAYD